MTGASCERKTVHEVDLQQDQTMTATLSPKVTYGMLPPVARRAPVRPAAAAAALLCNRAHIYV